MLHTVNRCRDSEMKKNYIKIFNDKTETYKPIVHNKINKYVDI